MSNSLRFVLDSASHTASRMVLLSQAINVYITSFGLSIESWMFSINSFMSFPLSSHNTNTFISGIFRLLFVTA